MNVSAVQAFRNLINLEKPKQGQDTDMHAIDTDGRSSRADIRFASAVEVMEQSFQYFIFFLFLLNQHYRVHLSSKNSSLVGRKEEAKHGSYLLCLSRLTSSRTPKDYLVS